jgi:hypothetical protein
VGQRLRPPGDVPQCPIPQALPYPARWPADALRHPAQEAERPRVQRAAWLQLQALIPRCGVPGVAGVQSGAARAVEGSGCAVWEHLGSAGSDPANSGWAILAQRGCKRLAGQSRSSSRGQHWQDERRLAPPGTLSRLPEAGGRMVWLPGVGQAGAQEAVGPPPQLHLFFAEWPSARRPASTPATSRSSASVQALVSPLPHHSCRYVGNAGEHAPPRPLPTSWSGSFSRSRRLRSGNRGSPCSLLPVRVLNR